MAQPTKPGYYWARRLHNDSCIGYEPAVASQSWGPWKVLHLQFGFNRLGQQDLRLRAHDFDYQGDTIVLDLYDWGPAVLPPDATPASVLPPLGGGAASSPSPTPFAP